MNLPICHRQSTEVYVSWQTKIKAVEAGINRSAAGQGTLQMIRNAQGKRVKKVANVRMESKANRTSPVRVGPKREERVQSLIDGPTVAMIRTERADTPDLSGFAR